MNRVEEQALKLLEEGCGQIAVRKSGSYRFQPSYRYEAHRHLEYEINYVLSGKCMMIFDAEYVPLKAGECIVISPFQNHGFLVDARSGCKIQQTEARFCIPGTMKREFPFSDGRTPYYLLRNCEDMVPIMEQVSRFHRIDKEEYKTALLDLAVL